MSALSRLLEPQADRVYAVVRILFGLLFAFHGAQKIFGIFASSTPDLFSQIWIGGLIELIGGACVAAGLFTRAMAILCCGTMAVAYVQFHWKLRFDEFLLPRVNKGEMALMYSFMFLYLACRGPGALSVDRWRKRRSS
jgi:putative oxidoreductase